MGIWYSIIIPLIKVVGTEPQTIQEARMGKTWLKLDMSRKQNRRIHHRVGRRLVQDHFAVRIAKRNPLKNLATLGLREHKPHADLLVDN